MKFSYSEVWNDTVALLRANGAIVVALAGVFLFLPNLAMSHFLPPPTTERPDEVLQLWIEYLNANWHWLLLGRLVTMAGTIALLLLFLDPRGRSVGALIVAAIMILPFFFITGVLMQIMIVVGLILLIVPGLYLIGRLLLVAPALVAENIRNPIAAISRSFDLTRGNGWAVLGLFLLVAVAGLVIVAVIGLLLGILFIAVAGHDFGVLLTQIVQAIGQAAFGAVVTALVAALYRQLASGAKASASD
jgi:hypothetical protein